MGVHDACGRRRRKCDLHCGDNACHLRLRAERAGTANGRVYTITIACTDSAGNTSTQNVPVLVPKNQKK
jgi:hypothetical protein